MPRHVTFASLDRIAQEIRDNVTNGNRSDARRELTALSPAQAAYVVATLCEADRSWPSEIQRLISTEL